MKDTNAHSDSLGQNGCSASTNLNGSSFNGFAHDPSGPQASTSKASDATQDHTLHLAPDLALDRNEFVKLALQTLRSAGYRCICLHLWSIRSEILHDKLHPPTHTDEPLLPWLQSPALAPSQKAYQTSETPSCKEIGPMQSVCSSRSTQITTLRNLCVVPSERQERLGPATSN